MTGKFETLATVFTSVALGSALTFLGMNQYEKSVDADLREKGYVDIRINTNDSLIRTLERASWEIADSYNEASGGGHKANFALLIDEGTRFRKGLGDRNFTKGYILEFGGTVEARDGTQIPDSVEASLFLKPGTYSIEP